MSITELTTKQIEALAAINGTGKTEFTAKELGELGAKGSVLRALVAKGVLAKGGEDGQYVADVALINEVMNDESDEQPAEAVVAEEKTEAAEEAAARAVRYDGDADLARAKRVLLDSMANDAVIYHADELSREELTEVEESDIPEGLRTEAPATATKKRAAPAPEAKEEAVATDADAATEAPATPAPSEVNYSWGDVLGHLVTRGRMDVYQVRDVYGATYEKARSTFMALTEAGVLALVKGERNRSFFEPTGEDTLARAAEHIDLNAPVRGGARVAPVARPAKAPREAAAPRQTRAELEARIDVLNDCMAQLLTLAEGAGWDVASIRATLGNQ